jgi:energy-coupling factor transporter transmembrane protein EcfT
VKPALAYSPGRSPLHRASAAAAVTFLGVLAVIAFAYSSPLVLLADGIAVVIAGFAAGARRAVLASLRFALRYQDRFLIDFSNQIFRVNDTRAQDR